MKKILTGILLTLIVQVVLAQNIVVENFQHHKHYFWQINSSLPIDKQSAVLLLKTGVKGLQFKSATGSPVDFEEGEAGIVLKVPDKTKFIIINHPDLGDYHWRVPVKNLKKHNYYTAELSVRNLTKEYKNPNQWVVFNISPETAIITIDSVMYRINKGELSLYLPVGKHSYTVESPFYESQTDSIILTDSAKMEKSIYLQPQYSYLTVKSEDPQTQIYVDGKLQGYEEITIGRIAEGQHRLTILKNNDVSKDTMIHIARAEKKTIILPPEFTEERQSCVLSENFVKNPSPNIYREITVAGQDPVMLVKRINCNTDSDGYAHVHLIAEDSISVIKIDREIVGIGEWTGDLENGFHLVTTEKDGLESISQYLQIDNAAPMEINLAVPQSSVGKINLHGNVVGALVFKENELIGEIPLVIENIKADEDHTFTLRKEGYKDRILTVRPKGNEMLDVYIKLKEK